MTSPLSSNPLEFSSLNAMGQAARVPGGPPQPLTDVERSFLKTIKGMEKEDLSQWKTADGKVFIKPLNSEHADELQKFQVLTILEPIKKMDGDPFGFYSAGAYKNLSSPPAVINFTLESNHDLKAYSKDAMLSGAYATARQFRSINKQTEGDDETIEALRGRIDVLKQESYRCKVVVDKDNKTSQVVLLDATPSTSNRLHLLWMNQNLQKTKESKEPSEKQKQKLSNLPGEDNGRVAHARWQELVSPNKIEEQVRAYWEGKNTNQYEINKQEGRAAPAPTKPPASHKSPQSKPLPPEPTAMPAAKIPTLKKAYAPQEPAATPQPVSLTKPPEDGTNVVTAKLTEKGQEPISLKKERPVSLEKEKPPIDLGKIEFELAETSFAAVDNDYYEEEAEVSDSERPERVGRSREVDQRERSRSRSDSMGRNRHKKVDSE